MMQTAIGRTIRIATNTVESHLLHLFDKTGCWRRVDWSELAANPSLPIHGNRNDNPRNSPLAWMRLQL